jgi:hypothetical protein
VGNHEIIISFFTLVLCMKIVSPVGRKFIQNLDVISQLCRKRTNKMRKGYT